MNSHTHPFLFIRAARSFGSTRFVTRRVSWHAIGGCLGTTTINNNNNNNTDRPDVGTGPEIRSKNRLCGTPVRGRVPPAGIDFQRLPELRIDDPGPPGLRQAAGRKDQSRKQGSRSGLWGELRGDAERVDGEL